MHYQEVFFNFFIDKCGCIQCLFVTFIYGGLKICRENSKGVPVSSFYLINSGSIPVSNFGVISSFQPRNSRKEGRLPEVYFEILL